MRAVGVQTSNLPNRLANIHATSTPCERRFGSAESTLDLQPSDAPVHGKGSYHQSGLVTTSRGRSVGYPQLVAVQTAAETCAAKSVCSSCQVPAKQSHALAIARSQTAATALACFMEQISPRGLSRESVGTCLVVLRRHQVCAGQDRALQGPRSAREADVCRCIRLKFILCICQAQDNTATTAEQHAVGQLIDWLAGVQSGTSDSDGEDLDESTRSYLASYKDNFARKSASQARSLVDPGNSLLWQPAHFQPVHWVFPLAQAQHCQHIMNGHLRAGMLASVMPGKHLHSVLLRAAENDFCNVLKVLAINQAR